MKLQKSYQIHVKLGVAYQKMTGQHDVAVSWALLGTQMRFFVAIDLFGTDFFFKCQNDILKSIFQLFCLGSRNDVSIFYDISFNFEKYLKTCLKVEF